MTEPNRYEKSYDVVYHGVDHIPELQTPTNFVNWLKNQPSDSIVGRGGDGERCPLATWLIEILNDARGLRVCTYEMYIFNYETTVTTYYYLPTWAIKFINTIDLKYHHSELISARDVLEILEAI